MAAQARALEDEVQRLGEQEPTKHTALVKQRLFSRVGQFLMGSLNMQHWWCDHASLMVFMMRVLELYPASESVCAFYKRMEQQLRQCRQCVDTYHAALPSVRVELEFEFTSESITSYFVKLQELDADRVQRQLADTSMGLTSAVPGKLKVMAHTLYEVLHQRRLLSDFRIVRVLSRWVSSPFADVKANSYLEGLRGCAGLYQLLVSPDSAVREWAKNMVQHFGKIQLRVDCGEDQHLLDVLDEWMYILENEEFNKSMLSLDYKSTEELQDFLEPTNCVKTPTKSMLWSALDDVIQQMDVDSLEAMLVSFDTIPDVVFNYLQEADPAGDQTLTLVVSKCFAVLLRCLGHRFWNHSANSPKVVLDVIMQHCRLSSWRVYVTKQFIELLPPLLVTIRPPQVICQPSNEGKRDKLDFYLGTRKNMMQFLIAEDFRPKHYDAVAIVAASRAAFTILHDCYEHRIPGSVDHGRGSGRDEGALSESISVDYLVSESAFWWPCSVEAGDVTNNALGKLWMNHLFDIVIIPNNVESLVDLAAETTALVLSKHLQLARDAVYSEISASDVGYSGSSAAVTKRKPIITGLLEKLCSWGTITTIPLQVHGALFESIGGISELLNSVVAQANISDQLRHLTTTLQKYEKHVQQYLQRMCSEVLCKGLTNPFGFPVVAQHISACYLSPTNSVDQMVNRLICQYAVDKMRLAQAPSPLEAVIFSVRRNAEAFLRGQLSMLRSMRLYGFSQAVCLPAAKKLMFVWSRIYDLLSVDLENVFNKVADAKAKTTSSHHVTDTGIAAAHLLKLPNLINDFLIALLASLFGPKAKHAIEITETTRVQCLDFGLKFWKFWTSVSKDSVVSSKRVVGLITPLVECIARGSASENKRAAELLMTVLGCLLEGNTRLDEVTLNMIDSIKGEAASVESRQSTDFGRMTKKFRQLSQNSQFFTKRSTGSGGAKKLTDMTSRSKSAIPPRTKSSAGTLNYALTSMSVKSAGKAQDRKLIDLSGADEVSNQAAARKQHSFYSEEEYHTASKKASSLVVVAPSSKSPFDMAQVIKGVSHSHPSSSTKTIPSERPTKQVDRDVIEHMDEEKKEEDVGLRFAALFHRIKATRKPIATCSLLPFYRQLLQVCMPVLLSGEFQDGRSDKELQAPGLSFTKNADYVRAFLPLMLEECNNEVQEGLRKYCRGNRGHLLRYESEKPREGMRCISFSIVQKDEALLTGFQAKFGGKRRPRSGFDEKLFRNGDVVLLQISAESQNQGSLMGKREFLGVILISETEKGRRQTSSTKKNSKDRDEECVTVLFLNDGELDNATASVRSFATEVLAASAITDTEWKVSPLCNLVTSAREYIALRSVDMLPEHLRTAILTPEAYKSTQSELITITSALTDLRSKHSRDSRSDIVKLLKRLDKIDVMLTDLRSTSIGKAVNRLRKHEDAEVKALSDKLKEKWTSLLDDNAAMERAPRFLSPALWEAIKLQYNSSQLQSIHTVLNNYSMGVSLLQGPPGTGKTKTIMGLLGGLLSLRLPATAVMPTISSRSSTGDDSKGEFSNFEAARSRGVSAAPSSGPTSTRPTATPFSLSGITSALGSVLRRSSDSSAPGPSRTTIQSLKNGGASRSRLETKLSSRTTHQPPQSNLVVKRRVISRAMSEHLTGRTNNILVCAPSNGAVNELVLRIVTDGLMDSSGNVTKVRAPSVHHDALSDERISIIRLGNAGEDASEIVGSVCLPHIIRREMAIHPKAMELNLLQETQRQLRSSIRDFHNKTDDPDGPKKDRKALAMMHKQLTGCSGKIRRLRDEVTAIRAKMTESLLSKASIIACTLSKAGSGDFLGLKHGFDALIIDEAAQAVELSTLVPIRERVARVVLVGDPKQLPATVKSVVAAKARYDRSLFERIAESGVAPSMLRVQYRMHPFLREFPSERFYGGMLTDGPSVMKRVQKVCSGVYAHTSFQPFLLYDVENSREEDMNGSKYNRVEAAFCVSLCRNMFSICAETRINKWSVGFVSPYKEQVRVLRQEITRSGIPASVSVEVNTVDGFQGREKDVIVFSCVRSSRRGGIGFLRDVRRLNVAITRARYCLYVIGNVSTLMRDETWAALIKSARDRKLVIRTEGEDFSAVVKRLATDKYRELAEHYKSMHVKVAPKSVATVKPVKTIENKPAEITKSKLCLEEEGKTVDASNTDVGKDEVPSRSTDIGEEAKGCKPSESDRPSLTSARREPRPQPPCDQNKSQRAVRQPVDSQKRSAEETFDVASAKKARSSVEAVSSAADVSDRYEIRRFCDRGNSSLTNARQGREHRFDETAADQTRNGCADLRRKEVGREEPSRLCDSRGSFDVKRDKRREDVVRPSDRYRRENSRDDDSRNERALVGSSHTSRPPVAARGSKLPRSISEKEFCQVNEPPPLSKANRLHSASPKARDRRPHHESSYPATHPKHRSHVQSSRGHDRSASSGKSDYRNKSSSHKTHSSIARTPSSRSTNVLGSILGSASKLANATSRVKEKTNSRYSEAP
ncbi:unnamed protein product [Hyaloperonospora brassicae]|uniref:TFIIS N-terminal domain-containing protein n=1 Tax=Hyaloperonospora brassicae TaxID=162125 RepID=A0AAV0TPC2_HYABA|nr:unnamed protein product [Hyaloperonospora brassicae]